MHPHLAKCNLVMLKASLPWVSLEAALLQLAKDESCFVFLHSTAKSETSGRYSYLALHPEEIAAGSNFSPLETALGTGKQPMENAWFGYFGYELLQTLESVTSEQKGYITLPDLWFAQFRLVLVFDQHDKTVTAYHAKETQLPKWQEKAVPDALPAVESLASPMTRASYLSIVNETKEAIARGDFYQANITRKFVGQFAGTPDPISIFLRLIKASPSPYSALIRMGNASIISSSPECFLKIDASGHMESSPIKGTAPRFADKKQDEASKQYLATSEKERAENLMIVDLMRNDFSRSCVTGSVETKRLFEISSYATLYHMASTITGQKRTDVSTVEAIKNCFPPGSMTGAPKIHAMKWCASHENIRRGVYSGALGWLGGDGSCELSVVIRTLIIEGDRFEFQVGGGITSGSDPEKEWQETITKARGLMAALGLDTKRLEEI